MLDIQNQKRYYVLYQAESLNDHWLASSIETVHRLIAYHLKGLWINRQASQGIGYNVKFTGRVG